MADIENVPIKPGGTPNSTPGGGKKKELSMEIRLLLAFLLMGLVLFLTPYIYKAPPPPKKPVTAPVTAQLMPEQKNSGRRRAGCCRRTGTRSDPSECGAGIHHRYAGIPHSFRQSRRSGDQLGAEEVSRSSGKAAGAGESRSGRQSSFFHFLFR